MLTPQTFQLSSHFVSQRLNLSHQLFKLLLRLCTRNNIHSSTTL